MGGGSSASPRPRITPPVDAGTFHQPVNLLSGAHATGASSLKAHFAQTKPFDFFVTLRCICVSVTPQGSRVAYVSLNHGGLRVGGEGGGEFIVSGISSVSTLSSWRAKTVISHV